MLIINIGELQQQQQQSYITLTVLTGLHGNPSSHFYPFLLIIPAREKPQLWRKVGRENYYSFFHGTEVNLVTHDIIFHTFCDQH